MFRGCFEHAIDDKGRLSIPAKFREVLDSSASPLVVTCNLDSKSLVAYPYADWRVLEAKIEALPEFDPAAQSLRRFFCAPAQHLTLDKPGRVLIAPSLRTHAGLDRQVVLAGMGKKFEIWDKDRYNQMMEQVMQDPAAIAQAIAGLAL